MVQAGVHQLPDEQLEAVVFFGLVLAHHEFVVGVLAVQGDELVQLGEVLDKAFNSFDAEIVGFQCFRVLGYT